MREILFRGKTKQGYWEYGFFDYNVAETDFIIHVVADTPPTLGDPGGDVFSERYPVIPETVGQFTGLTDKNGVKIFEGDIVKMYSEIMPEWAISIKEVSWYKEEGCWSLGRRDSRTIWEVIGNIHENPELF